MFPWVNFFYRIHKWRQNRLIYEPIHSAVIGAVYCTKNNCMQFLYLHIIMQLRWSEWGGIATINDRLRCAATSWMGDGKNRFLGRIIRLSSPVQDKTSGHVVDDQVQTPDNGGWIRLTWLLCCPWVDNSLRSLPFQVAFAIKISVLWRINTFSRYSGIHFNWRYQLIGLEESVL